MLAMLKYPGEKRKCQEELDAVVGCSQMPVFPDKECLSYTAATVCKCLQWKLIDHVGKFLLLMACPLS